jgi:hypothetical protein
MAHAVNKAPPEKAPISSANSPSARQARKERRSRRGDVACAGGANGDGALASVVLPGLLVPARDGATMDASAASEERRKLRDCGFTRRRTDTRKSPNHRPFHRVT